MSSTGLRVVAGIAAVLALAGAVFTWIDIGNGRDAAAASAKLHKTQRCTEAAPGCDLWTEPATVDGQDFGGLLVEEQGPDYKVGYRVWASFRVNEPTLTSGDQVTTLWWDTGIIEVDDPGHAPYLSSGNPDAYRPTWPFLAPISTILVIIAVAALMRARQIAGREVSPEALARIRARHGSGPPTFS